MGSFDVACSVSGVTINCGDPVVYFPLKENEYRDKLGDRFLIYANCLYEPVCLPVFGEYGDYGDVEIVHDKNVDVIEQHFNEKIGVIVNDESPGMPKPIVSGMFVHREIYDHLAKNQSDEEGNDEKGIFGFDGKTLEEIFDDASETIKLARARAIESIEWNEAHAKENEKDNPSFARKLRARKPEFTWGLEGGSPSIFTYGSDYTDFRKLYYNSIEEGELKKELCDFWKFHMAIYSSNKFYHPAMNGCQHGNHYQARILAEKTLEILDEKIKERESW